MWTRGSTAILATNRWHMRVRVVFQALKPRVDVTTSPTNKGIHHGFVVADFQDFPNVGGGGNLRRGVLTYYLAKLLPKTA